MSYATVQQVKDLGLPPDALEEVDDAQVQEFLTLQADVIDGYLGSTGLLPITVVSPMLQRINIDLAVCDILMWRGYNAEDKDLLYCQRCDKWHSFLDDVARGIKHIPGIGDGGGGGTAPKAAPVSTMSTRGFTADRGKITGIL